MRMRNGLRRCICCLLAVLLVAAVFPAGMLASAATGDTTVIDLKTEDLRDPIGIDAQNPVFSWKMQSDVMGQRQTAYQIKVATDADFVDPVWDSGKVAKDASVGIAYAGEALQASTKYYWQVTVWDKDGKEVKSPTATFEMGLLGADAWAGSDWIQLGSSTRSPEGIKAEAYTIDADIQVENTCVALVFQAQNKQNFLMWQVSVSSGKLMLNPHYNRSGYATIRSINMTDKVVGAVTDVQHLKVDVDETGVTTYLNGQLVDTIPTASLGGQGFAGEIGYIGYRAHANANETGWMDNIVVTDQDGKVVKSYDFNDGANPFDSGEVVDGRLHTTYVGKETIALEGEPEVAEKVHYTVEADVTCTGGAIGLLMNAVDSGNFYMVQLNTKDRAGKVIFNPHTWSGGAYYTYSSHVKDITSIVGTPAEVKTKAFHVKVDVTKDTLITYINGQQIDVTNVTELSGKAPLPQIASLGLRCSGGESGTVDNYKLTDYTDSAEGEVIYNYTFEDSNPYACGNLVDGRLVVPSGVGIVMPIDKAGVATFRKEFTPAKEIQSAKVYAAGLGVYDLFIDGKRVGHLQEDGSYIYDELKPGYTHHTKRMHYYTYDVTQMLEKEQTSTLSAHVTTGWWSGAITSYVGKNEALRLKMLLTYTDGSSEWICTDRTWKTKRTGPILYSDIFGGETYDGGASTDFRLSGYDDSDWTYANLNKEFSGTICAVVGPTIRIREDLELSTQSVTVYDSIIGTADDRYGKINVVGTYGDEAFTLKAGETAVVDLGQNFAGWEELRVEGKKGTRLTMRHAEILNDNEGLHSRGNDGPEGSIYIANLRSAAATGRYILSGNGVETYQPSTVFYGFRYLEITTTEDVTVHGIKGIVVTSVAEETGTISTSNARVNQLISNIFWGQYSNYLSVPTDCPQRDERKGWSADTQVFSTTAMYNADSKGFLRKYMYDMMDSQVTSGTKNGAYADTAPYVSSADIGQLGWADAGVIIPYNMYKMYGDKRIIEENWAAMQKYMDVYMTTTNKKGGSQRYGDWLAYESNDSEIKTMLGVAYYAWDALLMAEMAEILGKTADRDKYLAVYEDEKAYFIEQFVNADGSLKRTEQSVCLYALKLDLLPDAESFETVKQALLDNFQRNGIKLQTGFLGTAILMTTLSEIGETETAYQLLLQRDNPSWLYSVDQGATTIWERWNSYTLESGFGPVKMNSYNHYAYGAVAEWMYGYMAGILYDFDTPGFKHIILQPNPDPTIHAVDCSYDSAYGEIVSNWKYENGQFIYNATVPANTTATVYVPVEDGAQVLVGGKKADALTTAADGLRYMETVDGKAVFEAVAGSYQFTTTATEYCYIEFENSSSVEALLRINSGEPQAMTSGIALEKGKEVTLTVTPKGESDYACIGWDGDLRAHSASITFTPIKDLTLEPVYALAFGDNLALHKNATSSNGWETGGWKHAGLTDGINESGGVCPGYTTTKFNTTDINVWVEIDLGENTPVDKVKLYPRTDSLSVTGTVANFPVNFTIEVKGEGETAYTQVANYTDHKATAGKPTVVHFKTVEARYIRLNVTKVTTAASSDSGYNYLQLAEFAVFGDVAHVNDLIATLPAVDTITADNALEALTTARIAKAAYDLLPEDKQALITGANTIEAVLAAAEAVLPNDQPAPVLMGDVDESGTVDVADIMKLKALIMADKWTDKELAVGDLDESRKLDVGDIMAVKNIIMSK